MNLASKDIRHNFGRFALTTVGVGLLLMIVMGMGGIYRGLIHEATLLVDRIGADLWVVQRGTRGPFAEISRVPANLEDRARAVPGVTRARPSSRTPSSASLAGGPCASWCKGSPGRRTRGRGFPSWRGVTCAGRIMR